jgi:hypothetical protein
MLSSDLRTVYESYQNIYEEGDGISCEMIEEIVEELIEECLEFGHNIDEAADVVEEAALQYLMELNPYAPAGSKEAKAYQKSTTATKRGEARKTAVAAAKERVKSKVKGAVAGAGIAASIAKDEARRAGRKAAHAVSSTVQKKKAEVKTGVKSMIGRGLRKAAGAVGKVAQKAAGAASRLGEETQQLDELSDKKVQKTLKARERKFNRSVDSGAPNREFHQLRRTEKLVASRNKRTGSNIPVDEEIDTWDVVLEFLVSEGHADTNEEAIAIMSQLDQEVIRDIIEAQHARENPEKYEREQEKKYAPVRGEKTPMPPRGNKRREDFEKWYAKQMGR